MTTFRSTLQRTLAGLALGLALAATPASAQDLTVGLGSPITSLDPHYAILGVQPGDSLDEIKKKYRSLAVQWHPDKMAAKGASPEALRHAKEKFQQINEAYERIVDARK